MIKSKVIFSADKLELFTDIMHFLPFQSLLPFPTSLSLWFNVYGCPSL